MTKTNQQVIAFVNYARGFLADKEQPKTKWSHALERMDNRLKPVIEDYAQSLTDIQIDHASTDGENGPIQTDPQGNFRYTKDGLKARNRAQRELLQKDVEFEPYIATEKPESVDPACYGFVVEQPEE